MDPKWPDLKFQKGDEVVIMGTVIDYADYGDSGFPYNRIIQARSNRTTFKAEVQDVEYLYIGIPAEVKKKTIEFMEDVIVTIQEQNIGLAVEKIKAEISRLHRMENK